MISHVVHLGKVLVTILRRKRGMEEEGRVLGWEKYALNARF